MDLPILHYFMPKQDYWIPMIGNAVKDLAIKTYEADAYHLGECLVEIFTLALNDQQFLHPDTVNPIEHHLTVLSTACKIARDYLASKDWYWTDVKVVVIAALIHDICPIQRVASEATTNAPPKEKARLKARRECSISTHMISGAAMAHKLLCQYLSERPNAFKTIEIKRITDLISTHDNPQLEIPLPDDPFAIALREANRLWIMTPEGIAADLHHKIANGQVIAKDSPVEWIMQVVANLESLRNERALYCGFSMDNLYDTFFQTPIGTKTFYLYLRQWADVVRQNSLRYLLINSNSPLLKWL